MSLDGAVRFTGEADSSGADELLGLWAWTVGMTPLSEGCATVSCTGGDSSGSCYWSVGVPPKALGDGAGKNETSCPEAAAPK